MSGKYISFICMQISCYCISTFKLKHNNYEYFRYLKYIHYVEIKFDNFFESFDHTRDMSIIFAFVKLKHLDRQKIIGGENRVNKTCQNNSLFKQKI